MVPKKINYLLIKTGFKSRRRRHIWVEFVLGPLLHSKRFVPRYSGFLLSLKTNISRFRAIRPVMVNDILGDPGADSGDDGKSKRVGKYGTKKSRERREEPLGTMSYQTSSKRSTPLGLLIGARKLFVDLWASLILALKRQLSIQFLKELYKTIH